MARVARDLMTPNPECIREDETLLDAAKKLAQLNVGSLPICGNDNRLKGMVTDRDIVVKALAAGKDPASTRAGEFAQGEAVTIGADDSISETLQVMSKYQVRRLPVIDGKDLVGIIALADIARNVKDDEAGDVLAAVSSGG
jgi:CBS domain-containing protein